MQAQSLLVMAGVYPRTCGGTCSSAWLCTAWWGLSPHVRGNLQALEKRADGQGSIPARAGEPVGCGQSLSASRVYPRTCGGTISGVNAGAPATGLSPHVRGNRERRARVPSPQGSIPARAGEP